MGPRLLLAAAAAVALAGLLAPGAATAGAITRAAAADRALEVLKPARGNVAVFGLPRALPKGTRVAAVAATGRKGRGVRLARPAFLFWEDGSFGARFAHPGELLLLDARTGRTVLRAPTGYWPLVGGRVPAFLRSAKAYRGRTYRIDTRARPRVAARASAVSPGRYKAGAANGPFKVTPAQLAEECMVIVGDRGTTSQNVVTGNVRSMRRWAKDVGMRAIEAGPSPKHVEAQVDAYVGTGCKDVLLYLTGHGQPGAGANVMGIDRAGRPRTAKLTGGPASVITDQLSLSGTPGDPVLDGDKVTPADLQGILARHPSTEFKVKIDACFSGRFWEPLTGRDWRETTTAGRPAPYPNLRVLEVSSAPDEVSYASIEPTQALRGEDGRVTTPGEDPLDNPDGATYFTNSNLHGLYEWARDPGAVDEEVGRGAPPSFPRGLSGAFDAGKAVDVPRRSGLTHPRRQALPPLTTTTTPPPFRVVVKVTWRHIAPGSSEVCVDMSPDPATTPMRGWALTVSGPGLTSKTGDSGSFDGAGTARSRFPIDKYGTYTAKVTLGSQAGGTATGSGDATVTAEQGTCPPP